MKWTKRAFQPKNLAATISALVVLLTAIVLVILTVTNKLKTTESQLTGILLLLSSLAVSEIIARLGIFAVLREDIDEIKSKIGITKIGLKQARNFTPIDEFIKESKDVLLIGLDKISVLEPRINFFSTLIKNGCTVRLLHLDSNEPNLAEIVSRNLAISNNRLKMDIDQAVETIKNIRRNLTPEENKRLQVGSYTNSPGLGLVVVDGNKKTGKLQVYFYAFQSDPPERPGFEISREEEPNWFDYFVKRYEELWKKSYKEE